MPFLIELVKEKGIPVVPFVALPLKKNRALTPLFGNRADVHGIGKISGILTKIGKFDIILLYDVSIARLIPINKLL